MEDTEESFLSWTSLPDHIIVKIFSYLNLQDKFQASFVCKSWNDCFHFPVLWADFVFIIQDDNKTATTRHRKCLEMHGSHLKNVLMKIDQSKPICRSVACDVLNGIASHANRNLSSIKIDFTGENPLFYAGSEFVQCLKKLFGCNPEAIETPMDSLVNVDLSGMPVAFDDNVLNLLSTNHPKLESLNLLNKVLVCKVSPDCILQLVKKCRKLKKLFVFHSSMSDDTLVALAEDGRTPLLELGISCRRQEKYGSDLTSEAWQQLVTKLPELKVMLYFDHTCPLHRVSEIMKPEIPVHVLNLQTFTMIYEEVNQASVHYQNTLEVVVLQTRNSPELGRALVNLARNCYKLHTLIVYCVLKKEIVDEILALRPKMKKDATYVLKWKPQDEPWVVGVEEGD
ncbi:F-box/LRR-repeat protein 8-like [Ostrea edulis]|uniref:F-box/LRR-repeat protein 8-like n=1 Tax=Ostrea edulis TaxID=37623 RepID=UPI0024AFFBA1|nr:F-box/LRR-repeat protein 8-like [Ostrea edulis]